MDSDEWRDEMEKTVKELHSNFHSFKDEISEKLDTITGFISGANTVFGLARAHWKRVFVFGAGFMTAAGVGNPQVNTFIVTFFGGV